MNEHTGSEPLAVCTALSPVALINTEASLEISYYFVGAGQQPKFRDMEPAVAVPQMDRKVLLGILAGQKKRGKGELFCLFLNFLFSPISYFQPLGPNPQNTHAHNFHLLLLWLESKAKSFMFLTVRPSKWRTYKHLFLQEKGET